MLGEKWNQVAEWGIETIKNIQTNIGLADEEHVLLASQLKYASTGGRSVSFLMEEVEGSAQIAPVKAKKDKGVTSEMVSILKAKGEELTKLRQTSQAKITKLGQELVAARANGHENDSTHVKALKTRLQDLRTCAQELEQSWNGVDGMLKDAMAATAYIHINKGSFSSRKPSPEPQRSDKGDMQSPRRPSASARQLGSSRGRRSPDDEIIFKGRSLSVEGLGFIGTSRSRSSESSSPTRSAPNPPLASCSQRSISKKLLPAK